MTICHFQGGDVDCSRFLPEVGATELAAWRARSGKLGCRFEALCDMIWHRGGSRVAQGRRVVQISRSGDPVLVPVRELTPLEFASLLYPAPAKPRRRRD